jgi:hypothetical protein
MEELYVHVHAYVFLHPMSAQKHTSAQQCQDHENIQVFFLYLVAVGNNEMWNLLSIFHCGFIISSLHVDNLICNFQNIVTYVKPDFCRTCL